MNLNINPTVTELSAVFAAADDEAGHHVLWVDTSGEVHLTVLGHDTNPVAFESSQPSLKMRYETFCQGNGYVGPEASKDEHFMSDVLHHLVKHWNLPFPAGRPKYIDVG